MAERCLVKWGQFTALKAEHGIQLQCSSKCHAESMRWAFYRARCFHRLVPDSKKYEELKFCIKDNHLRLVNKKGQLEKQDKIRSPDGAIGFRQ